MGRTFVRQDAQIRQSVSYDDTVAPASAMETGSTNLEADLNNLRSQVLLMLDVAKAGNWFDDIVSVTGLGAAKKRSIKQLNTDLDDLEEKRIICAVQQLTDLTVPSIGYATASLTTVVQANLVDGETFDVYDGHSGLLITFEFDTNASVVTGNVQVDISGDITADDVKTTVINAVNGVTTTLLVTASDGGSATVTLTQDHAGTNGNGTNSETVTDTGFAITNFTGGTGDVIVLNQANSETPSESAAIGTGFGAIVAILAGDVGSWDLAEIAGSGPPYSKNLVWVRDASLHEGLTSDGRQIYGLLQAENGVVQGDAFNDTDKQVQISFVRINDADELEHCPGQDIGGKVIEYIYGTRKSLDTLPEDCGFPGVFFTDGSASVSVTLNNAIDNQGVVPATQDTNVFWDLTTASVSVAWRDAAAAALFTIVEGSAGGTSEVQVNGDTDVFNVDAVENNFANGLKADTSGQEIDVGVTSGTIESTGSNDLRILGAAELFLDDGNQTGSSWAQTDGIKLSETQAEWNTFESEFGEVSLLNAISQAKNTGGLVRSHSVAILTTNVSANTDVGGVAGGANLDAQLGDYSSLTFVGDVDVFVNGVLQRNGADASANHDVYPGTSAANGQLKFEYNLHGTGGNADVITMITWAGV